MPGQRVRRRATEEAGVIVSKDGQAEGTTQTIAPNFTYTVKWDSGGPDESMVYAKQLTPE